MAESKEDHTNAALASRLVDHADSITNVAAHQMEQDIRLAAERLRDVGEPEPEVVALITRLRQVAHETPDSGTTAKILGMLGELAN